MHRRDLLTLASALPLAACGRSTPTVHLYIQSDGDFLMYKPDELTVPTRARVTLTFHHAGAIISQQHDWVLAKPGTMDALLAESDKAAEASGGEDMESFLKPNDTRIIAATPEIKKGETATITFTAPTPGDYPFFCSTPGHADTMRGVLHVTAQ